MSTKWIMHREVSRSWLTGSKTLCGLTITKVKAVAGSKDAGSACPACEQLSKTRKK